MGVTDHRGHPLAVGDIVLIPCVVVQIHHDEQFFPHVTDITVETKYAKDEMGPGRMYLNASQVEKVVAADTEKECVAMSP